MNKTHRLLLCGILLGCGCVPRLRRYEHVLVQEAPGLSVITRSNGSDISEGKPLRGAKIGLPITSVISSSSYSVSIYTPLNFQPVLFLRVEGTANSPLQLRGANIRELKKSADARVLTGYTHVYDLNGTSRGQIELEIVSETGQVLGREKIGYQVVSRGYRWEERDSL